MVFTLGELFIPKLIHLTCVLQSIDTQKFRVIPQGTVDNNLGPDRLAGAKALDPNYCSQSTL